MARGLLLSVEFVLKLLDIYSRFFLENKLVIIDNKTEEISLTNSTQDGRNSLPSNKVPHTETNMVLWPDQCLSRCLCFLVEVFGSFNLSSTI